MNEQKLNRLKQMYQTGTRICLQNMEGENLPAGLKGTVEFVGDIGQIQVAWDNGRGLALNMECDRFYKIETIDVVIVKPNQLPYKATIENQLSAFKEIVGGKFENVILNENYGLICNEEGKLLGLPPNRRVGNDVIVGSFIIVGLDGSEDFVSLSEELQDDMIRKFNFIDELTQEDVQSAMTFEIRGM